jgi:phenol hydroxylase P0 protein
LPDRAASFNQIKHLATLAQALRLSVRPGHPPQPIERIEQMKLPDTVSDKASAAALTGQPCFVRVTGTLAERFVEFEFAIGDPELAVELVLQFDQFRQFCATHQVTRLSADEGARLDFERMKWRFGAPGIDH